MSLTRRSIPTPNSYHLFEYLSRQPDPAPVELPVVLICPHRQVFSAFDAAGSPRPDALLGSYSFEEGSYGYAMPDGMDFNSVQFEVPSLSPGARVESVEIVAESGVGASRTTRNLRSPQGAEILVTRTSGEATLVPDATLDGKTFMLVDASTNFFRALRRKTVTYPTTDAEYSAGNLLYVEIGGVVGGPFIVIEEPTAANPYSMLVEALTYTPIYTSTSVNYSLVLNPAEFSVLSGPLAANLSMGCFERQLEFEHLRLTKPGQTSSAIASFHGVLEIDCPPGNQAALHGQTITLTNSADVDTVVYFDVDSGGGAPGGAVVIEVTSVDDNAADVAALVATGLFASGNWWACVDSQETARVRIHQKLPGTAGNTEATFTGAWDFFGTEGDPKDFVGGGASLTSFTLRNFTSTEMLLVFTAATPGTVTHPTTLIWTKVASKWDWGTFRQAATGPLTAHDLNVAFTANASEKPYALVEPSSVSGYTASTNVTGSTSPLKSLVLSSLITTHTAAFTDDDDAGQFTIPPGETRPFALVNRLTHLYRTTDTFTLTFGSNDREGISAQLSGTTVTVEFSLDAGVSYIGREPGVEGVKRWQEALNAANAKILELYQDDRGYEHAHPEALWLAAPPEDVAFLNDPDVDVYPIPGIVENGINTAGSSIFPDVYTDPGFVTGALTRVWAPITVPHVAVFEYRSPGEAGNDLNVNVVLSTVGEVDLEVVADGNDFTIYVGSADGIQSGTKLDELAVLLDTQNDDLTYVYPLRISRVINTTTGAEVNPTDDDYSGWSAIPLTFASLEGSYDYTDLQSHARKGSSFSGSEEGLSYGSDADVIQVDKTLRGLGSVGSLNLYASYVALRTDTSPIASIDVHGRTPDLIRVRSSDDVAVVGETHTDNPLSIALAEFRKTGGGRTVYVLGVDEVSDTHPWGTPEALARALSLAKRRNGYHIFVMNPASFVLPDVVEIAQDIEGTATRAQKKALLFYTPHSVPSVGLDRTIAEGSQIVAGTSEDGLTPVITDLDFIENGVEAGDYIVSRDYPLAGPYVLQDGRRGFKVASVSTASPTRAVLEGTAGGSIPTAVFSTPGNDKPFDVVRKGQTLTVGGVYDSAAALETLLSYHAQDGFYHAGLAKHFAGPYKDLVNGVQVELESTYLLAQYAGIIARTEAHIPTSTAAYSSTISRYDGPSKFFDEDQLSQLTGIGLTMPTRFKEDNDSAIIVRRDVSSDTSGPPGASGAIRRVFQRRSARVAQHLMTLRIDAVVKPRMGPALITPQFLDLIARLTDGVLEYFRANGVFASVAVKGVVAIDDAIREATGIDDSGVYVDLELRHYEEAAASIFRHLVSEE